MEGVYDLDAVEARVREVKKAPAPKYGKWPGWTAVALVAALSYAIHYLPFSPFQVLTGDGVRRPISASTVAILFGLLARNLLALSPAVVEGAKRIVKQTLPATIILTGAGLNLLHIANAGAPALMVTVSGIAIATLSAVWIGRRLNLQPGTGMLIGVGTAICGTSAIVAAAPLIRARDEDLSLSVGVINLLGLALMFAFPPLGALLALNDQQFGIWAGASIHAVPQVVAAGFAFSAKAGALATLVKLVRVAMLAPFLFLLGALYLRGQSAPGAFKVHYWRLVPSFLWGFVALSLANTLGLFPTLHFATGGVLRGASIPLSAVLAELSNALLAIAMSALGLEVDLRFMAKVGGPALLTGVLASVALCAGSLALIMALV